MSPFSEFLDWTLRDRVKRISLQPTHLKKLYEVEPGSCQQLGVLQGTRQSTGRMVEEQRVESSKRRQPEGPSDV
jgi:hypothetical protein